MIVCLKFFTVKNILTLFICFSYFAAINAQTLVPYLQLNGKYIFADSVSMKKVIDKEFDYARPFAEGISCVIVNGKYGFVDKAGNAITEIKYDHANDFENGLAMVYYDSKNSFIDKTGKELFPSDYMLGPFRDGLTLAKNKNSKYGFLDKTGKEIIPCNYDGAGSFAEGMAWVKLNNKFGFINNTGKLIVPMKYDKAESFLKSLAVVAVNGKYGYIDKKGKEIIPLKYSDASNSIGDLLKVQIDSAGLPFSLKGYLDRTGKIIIPLKYVLLDDFGNGKFLAASNKIQIINRKNEKLVELNEYDGWSSVKDGIAFLKRRFNTPDAGKYVMINSDGKEVTPARYELVNTLIDGAIDIKNNGKWGFIDKTGNQITPPRYDDKLSFEKGLARVKPAVNTGINMQMHLLAGFSLMNLKTTEMAGQTTQQAS
jgi:WG containing repeat